MMYNGVIIVHLKEQKVPLKFMKELAMRETCKGWSPSMFSSLILSLSILPFLPIWICSVASFKWCLSDWLMVHEAWACEFGSHDHLVWLMAVFCAFSQPFDQLPCNQFAVDMAAAWVLRMVAFLPHRQTNSTHIAVWSAGIALTITNTDTC